MAAPAVEGVAVTALRAVFHRVRQAAERSGRRPDDVRVVAVSKTKPISLIRQVYDAGHRCFGENYVQEIVEKAPQLPDDIEWHYVGHLQSNKVKSLLGIKSHLAVLPVVYMLGDKKTVIVPKSLPGRHGNVLWNIEQEFMRANMQLGIGYESAVPNLAMFEGIDNERIANHLDRVVSSIGRNPLKVLVQVNTSGEPSKSGVDPSGCLELVKHVKLGCRNLDFSGLMTIGMPDYSSTPENFRTLLDCRTEVCKELGIAEDQCELSMGMSGDFEQAIEMGSTNVRIGSTIFGPREYPKKQQ